MENKLNEKYLHRVRNEGGAGEGGQPTQKQTMKYTVTLEDAFGRQYPGCGDPFFVSINDASTGKTVPSRFLPAGIKMADDGGGYVHTQLRSAQREAADITKRLAKRGLLA